MPTDFELAPWLYPLLCLTGLAAGFVDSIAGGGGLITIPVLLNIGMPPQLALGTNKLQACFGSASATWHYGRAGLIDFRSGWPGVLSTLLGAAAGSMLVNSLDPELLKRAIPWLLTGIAIYLLVQPRLGESSGQPRMDSNVFHVTFGMGIGFYDGFFGPGTGTFWAIAYVLALGFDLTRATANTKLMNFTSNVASLAVFLVAGHTHFAAGLCMGAGQMLGARMGSKVVILRGTRLIRPVFITVVLAITARLWWQNYSRAH